MRVEQHAETKSTSLTTRVTGIAKWAVRVSRPLATCRQRDDGHILKQLSNEAAVSPRRRTETQQLVLPSNAQ